MNKLAIYDLDGTVICSKHRYKTVINNDGTENIDLQFWRENCIPEKIAKDSLLPHAKQMVKDLLDPMVCVIVATARVMQDADFNFITENLGIPNYIVHREGEHDNRKGVDLKVTGITKNVNIHSFKNITIFEDNFAYLKGMVEAFENMGHDSVYPIFVPSLQGH